MCWMGYISDRRVADSDKKVWKVIIKYPDGHYETPFCYQQIKPNQIVTAKIVGTPLNTCRFKLAIDIGIHCCTDEFNATAVYNSLSYIDKRFAPVIVKCIIPKGTVYYENYGDIVCEKLIYPDKF